MPPGVGLGRGLGGRSQPSGGKGKFAGKGLKGVGRSSASRRQKLAKSSIKGITRGDIRRLARRGGVKRISATIYDDVRSALKSYLEKILGDCVTFLEYQKRSTVSVTDVIFALKRIGRPIYGFDKDTYNPNKRPQVPAALRR